MLSQRGIQTKKLLRGNRHDTAGRETKSEGAVLIQIIKLALEEQSKLKTHCSDTAEYHLASRTSDTFKFALLTILSLRSGSSDQLSDQIPTNKEAVMSTVSTDMRKGTGKNFQVASQLAHERKLGEKTAGLNRVQDVPGKPL